MSLFRWRVLALLVVTLAGPPALVAETGYVTRGDELGYLAWVDLPSGANGALIMDTGLNPMSGLALSPAGELFGVVVPSRFAPPGPARLVRVHPETQSLEFRGPLAIGIPEDLFDQDVGLAFDALGRLWLVTDDGRLFEVDPEDATTTAQVALGIPARGLAGCGRSLYALTHPTGSALPLSLVRIDPEAGTTTAFAPLESENPFFSAATGAGLDFGSDGRLFAVMRREDAIEAFTSFAELDPVRGELVSASTGLGWGPNGLAIAPPPASCPGRGVAEVPTASSLGLACLAGSLALAGAVFLRRSPRTGGAANRTIATIILAALAATGSALPARAQPTAYVGDAWESWGLRQVELPSGTWISSVLDWPPLSGLAMSPDGELFGVAILYTPFPSRPTPLLVKIDVDSHGWQSVGDLALPVLPWPLLESETGLAFDALGRLWLSTEDGTLYQVDPATAALSRRMNLGYPVAGLAGCGVTLFGLTDWTEAAPSLRLVRIDPDHVKVVALPPLPSDLGGSFGVGLDFDAQGRLWAVLNTVDPLHPPTNHDTMAELDPVTGQLIQSHPYFLLGSGLAIAPPPASCPGRGVVEVPTASSLALSCLAGFLALAGARLLRGSALRRGMR